MTAMFSGSRPALLFALILALMVVEALVLGLLWRHRSRGLPFLELTVSLMAGASLLLAAIFALRGAPAPWLSACLLLALLAHVFDLRLRWRTPATWRRSGGLPRNAR